MTKIYLWTEDGVYANVYHLHPFTIYRYIIYSDLQVNGIYWCIPFIFWVFIDVFIVFIYWCIMYTKIFSGMSTLQ